MFARREFNIPFVPALVDIDDVIAAGGRLIPENNVGPLIDTISLINDNADGRYTKNELNRTMQFYRVPGSTKYSIIKTADQYYAIYKGRQHGKIIGEGGFGAVKYVQNIKDGSWAVIKIISQKDKSAPNKAAIEREKSNLARTQQLLGHVSRSSKKSGTQDEIIMMLAKGLTVKKIIEHRKMAAVKWLDLSIAIATAIADIHADGIYHRDIKPANMLYDAATGVVTLIDFGLARAFNAETKKLLCSRGGTPKYTAPEISHASGDNAVYTYTEKTEVYALGRTLLDVYGLADHGREIDISAQFLVKINNVELRKSLIHLCRAMMHPNPEERPDIKTVIATLTTLRNNELDLASKINSMVFLDVDDYLTVTSEQKQAIITSLHAADVVHLCSSCNAYTEIACMRIKHELESQGVVVAPTAIELDARDDFEHVARTLREYAAEHARTQNVIMNSFYVQASKLSAGTEATPIHRSIDRVDITDQHKMIAATNIQEQITRLLAKNPLDPRLTSLRKFNQALKDGSIKTYQQLFSALTTLEQSLLDTPTQSKIGSFAKHHGLYSSTSASVVRQTYAEISNDAYGIRKSTTELKK